jgi:uncharacterized membrane protein YbhN (UPF0104 family)
MCRCWTFICAPESPSALRCLLPSNRGRFSKLKKYGLLQRSPGYGTFLVERTLDLVTLLAMGCVSLLTTVNVFSNRIYIYGVLVFLFLGCAGGLLVLMRMPVRGRLQQLSLHMRECVADFPTLLMVTAITCVSWAAVAVCWQVFLYSAGIQLEFPKAMAVMSIVALISIVSLIPGGLGVSEVGIARLLIHFGFSAATAQAGAVVLRACSLVAIVLGAIHLGVWRWIRKCRMRRLANATSAKGLCVGSEL